MSVNIRIATKYTGNAALVSTSRDDSPMGKLMQRAEKWGPKFKKKLMPELGAFTVRMLRQVAPIALYYNDDTRQPGTLKDGIDFIVSSLGIAINSIAIDPYTKVDYAPIMEFGGQSTLGTRYGKFPGLFLAQPYFYSTIEDIARQFVKRMPEMYKEYMKTGKIKKLSKYLNQSQILNKIKARNARHKETGDKRESYEGLDDVNEQHGHREYDPYDESARGLDVAGGEIEVGGERLREHTFSDAEKAPRQSRDSGIRKTKRVTKAQKLAKAQQQKSRARIPTKPATFRSDLKTKSAPGRNKRIQQEKRSAGSRPTWNRGNESSSQFQKRLAAYYKKG